MTSSIVIWPVDSPQVNGANSLKTQLLVFGVVLRWCSSVSAEAESIAALSVWDWTEATRAVDRGRSSANDPRIRKRGIPRRKSRPEHQSIPWIQRWFRACRLLNSTTLTLDAASQTRGLHSSRPSNAEVQGTRLFGHLIPCEKKTGDLVDAA